MKRKKKNATRRRNVSKKGLHSADFGLDGRLNKAGLLHSSGRLAEAEDVYKEILKIAPDHAVVLNLLGFALFQKEEYNAAAGFIKKAIRISLQPLILYKPGQYITRSQQRKRGSERLSSSPCHSPGPCRGPE